MLKWKLCGISLVVVVIAILLLPSAIRAWPSNTNNFISGYYGSNKYSEDPYTSSGGEYIPSYHPEIDSYSSQTPANNYVAIVFVSEIGPNSYIRVAISSDYGSSWNFEWVDTRVSDVNQEYPDVQIYRDYADNNDHIKMVVVWQEKPSDDSGNWEIKAREKDLTTGGWSLVTYPISIVDDNKDDIYPKVSACSDATIQTSYWNIVWQRDYLTNRYGIELRRFIRDTSNEGFNSIVTLATPGQDWDYDYKHPAVDSIISTQNYINIYVVYNKFHQIDPQTSNDEIIVVSGCPQGTPTGTFTQNGYSPVSIASSTNGDYGVGFPDIAVIGQVSGGMGDTVDCVWVSNPDTNEIVEYKRSTDSAMTFPDYQYIDSNGAMELRSVAIDMYRLNSNTYQSTVVWTTSCDHYYKIRTNGNNFPSQRQDGASTAHDEDFVDVTTVYRYTAYQQAICSIGTWQVDGTAVFTGRDPN